MRMDRWIVSETIDLATGQRTYTRGCSTFAIQGDKNSIEWEVTLLSNGEAATLTGCTCMLYAIRPDDTTAVAEGSVSGNVASGNSTQQFFALTGKVELQMVLTNLSDGTSITVSRLFITVERGPTDQIIDPGEVFPDLAEGLAAIQELSEYMLTETTVTDVVSVDQTDAHEFTVTYEDGTVYTLSVNDTTITMT